MSVPLELQQQVQKLLEDAEGGALVRSMDAVFQALKKANLLYEQRLSARFMGVHPCRQWRVSRSRPYLAPRHTGARLDGCGVQGNLRGGVAPGSRKDSGVQCQDCPGVRWQAGSHGG